MSAWDRQEKEPPKAYSHFCVYRDLGPQERTLENTAKIRGLSHSTTQELSQKYGWVQRCDQWDAHVQSTIDKAFLTEAAKQAKLRAKAFSDLLDKASAALVRVDIEKVYLRDIAAAMKIAAEGLRLEEGLETQRMKVELSDARAVIANLPAEVRKPLLLALAQHARQERDTSDFGGIPSGIESDPRESGWMED